MRPVLALALVLAVCSPPRPVITPPPPTPTRDVATVAAAPPERLAVDTPRTTVDGHAFTAPAGWTLAVRGTATILSAPERGSAVALVDVAAADVDAALAAAWAAYDPSFARPRRRMSVVADHDGWTRCSLHAYGVPPNEQREVSADVCRHGERWTVVLRDLTWATLERRYAQVTQIVAVTPRGRQRESFAGRAAHPLDAARVAELTAFIEAARRLTGVPGVAFGLVERGRVVHLGGFGVRALGEPAAIDGDTRFMIASNTKALTSLMLAKLVDAGAIGWDTAATAVLPTFRTGDDETTRKLEIRHLLCACTGLPRQDMQWLFASGALSPARVVADLARVRPTSGFGEMFQYSNALAAAGGYLGGHVAHPRLELGAAYDRAMQTLVFEPLCMRSTTFDRARGRRGNFAAAHALYLDGRVGPTLAGLNEAVVPVRPAGGAVSSARDLLRYVQMELGEGVLASGEVYIGKPALLARRAAQVPITADATHGMGLVVDRTYGVTLVGAGGHLYGYYSDMFWLPEHGVGAVLLTNGEPGWLIFVALRRKLLEVLFDGEPAAEAALAAGYRQFLDDRASDLATLTVPADPAAVAGLARRYHNAELGDVTLETSDRGTRLDFGEFAYRVGSRKHADGTVSLVTTSAGLAGFEVVVGPRRTLVIREAQQEYVFTPVDPRP